jgi:cathepsin B
MKQTIIVLFIIIGVACAALQTLLVNDEQIVKAINSNPKSTWQAKVYPQFEGMTLEHARQFLGAFTVDESNEEDGIIKMDGTEETKASLPHEFDARTQWSQCIGPIRNQEKCGSCWAFSGAAVLGDRYCIYSNGTQPTVLSPQFMLNCDHSNHGCNGGILSNEWVFLMKAGTTLDSCTPYVSSAGGRVPACSTKCQDGSTIKLYHAQQAVHFIHTHLTKMMESLVNHGPLQMAFNVYQDFFTYSSGVYRHTHGGLAGGHAVRIVGYGVDDASGLPYWTVGMYILYLM